jgi:hypothetical protein
MQRYESQAGLLGKKSRYKETLEKIVGDVDRAHRSKAEADAIKLLWEGKEPPK